MVPPCLWAVFFFQLLFRFLVVAGLFCFVPRLPGSIGNSCLGPSGSLDNHCATPSGSTDNPCSSLRQSLSCCLVPLTTPVPTTLFPWQPLLNLIGSLGNNCPNHLVLFPSDNHCATPSSPPDNPCPNHLAPVTTTVPSTWFPWQHLSNPSGSHHTTTVLHHLVPLTTPVPTTFLL